MAQQPPTPITVADGDGIGPEIMDATLHILNAAGARIQVEKIDIGEKVYLAGNSAGIAPEAFESIRRNKVFLKAPITTPQGGGYKSLNVATRKAFGLFANVRPCVSYSPFIQTKHPVMDVVIVRENEEDTYGGIEHRQTQQTTTALKIITYPGSEKIVRYAFEYAKHYNRKKVTCFMKDNIMKITDGLFHKIFDEVAAEYPAVEADHWIVDIGAAKMADTPENFDVIVMPNLYGDILSDVAAQIAGSVGLAGSANIGPEVAMFEAIHGSAPRRAGQNLANPSGLLLGAVMMLVHIGQPDIAERVHNAWLKTIEDGVHTYDVYTEGVSKQKVGTKEFAQAVADRVGQQPEQLKPVTYATGGEGFAVPTFTPRPKQQKDVVGVDVFIEWDNATPQQVGEAAQKLNGDGLELLLVSNRGTLVWPTGQPETFCVDHWCCRYLAKENQPIPQSAIVSLLSRFQNANLEFVKLETLCNFDGKPEYAVLKA